MGPPTLWVRMARYLWLICIFVERKKRFIPKKVIFSIFLWVLRMEKYSHGRVVPCPGKRPFASPKKAVVPLFPMRASAFCSPAISFPRVSLRRGNLRTLERFDPGFFWLRRLPFYPDNEKTGLNDQPNFKRSILADIPP